MFDSCCLPLGPNWVWIIHSGTTINGSVCTCLHVCIGKITWWRLDTLLCFCCGWSFSSIYWQRLLLKVLVKAGDGWGGVEWGGGEAWIGTGERLGCKAPPQKYCLVWGPWLSELIGADGRALGRQQGRGKGEKGMREKVEPGCAERKVTPYLTWQNPPRVDTILAAACSCSQEKRETSRSPQVTHQSAA